MQRIRQHIGSISLQAWLMALALTPLFALPTSAVEWNSLDGPARGYPVMRDLNGRRLADGDFSQWVADGLLHVRLNYTFDGGRTGEEDVTFRQRPQLAQESWAFREMQGKQTTRAFAVDFKTGIATATTDEKGETKHWSEKLDIVDGQTFAGFGFSVAIRALRERLIQGEVITLKGVGFAPKPEMASTELSYGGRDRVRMAGRTIEGDRFIVHPKIPAIAKLFVKVPDATIWLTTPPAGFLRWEGAMAEPSDQIIRVDLLPGGASEAAVPIAGSGARPVATSGTRK